VAEDGELLMEGEIFQSQLRAVPEEGAEEQEDDSEDGHRGLHLDKWVKVSGVVEYAGDGT
jgi:hypothetical protein